MCSTKKTKGKSYLKIQSITSYFTPAPHGNHIQNTNNYNQSETSSRHRDENTRLAIVNQTHNNIHVSLIDRHNANKNDPCKTLMNINYANELKKRNYRNFLTCNSSKKLMQNIHSVIKLLTILVKMLTQSDYLIKLLL